MADEVVEQEEVETPAEGSIPEVETPPEQVETPAESEQPVVPETPAAPKSMRDYTKEKHGLDVGSFQSDEAYIDTLLSAVQESQQWRGPAQKWMASAAEFERWQAEQAQRRPVDDKPKTIIDRQPEYDPRWETMVVEDPVTGALKPRPGAPFSVVEKLNAHREWQREWADALFRNPKAALKEVYESVIKPEQEAAFTARDEQRLYSGLIDQNAYWLFQTQNGDGKTFIQDHNGQPRLTQNGQRYFQEMQRLTDAGVKSAQARHEYAFQVVQGQLALSLLSQQQGAKTTEKANEAKKQQVVNEGAAARRPSRNGAAPAGARSLREKLFERMADAPDDLDLSDALNN